MTGSYSPLGDGLLAWLFMGLVVLIAAAVIGGIAWLGFTIHFSVIDWRIEKNVKQECLIRG